MGVTRYYQDRRVSILLGDLGVLDLTLDPAAIDQNHRDRTAGIARDAARMQVRTSARRLRKISMTGPSNLLNVVNPGKVPVKRRSNRSGLSAVDTVGDKDENQ